MSDMDNLMALKALLEGSSATHAETQEEKEKRFLKDAVKIHLGKDEDSAGLWTYHPEEMISFLEQPTRTLKNAMGGEWAKMDDMAFDNIVYTVNKKLKKSVSILDWKN
jgi:hypothetical protein